MEVGKTVSVQEHPPPYALPRARRRSWQERETAQVVAQVAKQQSIRDSVTEPGAKLWLLLFRHRPQLLR
jgi:hypothetical protein